MTFSDYRYNPFTGTFEPVEIIGEAHMIQEFDHLSNVYGIWLNEMPSQEHSVIISGYTEVLVPPLPGQFQVDYTETPGLIQFNVSDNLDNVLVNYYGVGTVMNKRAGETFANAGTIDNTPAWNEESIAPSANSVEQRFEHKQLFAHFRDVKTAGASGGTFTSGAWRTRDLNEELYNETGIVLFSNTLIIPAGTYRIECRCPAYRVDTHKTRLYNITDSSVILIGTSEMTLNAVTGSCNTSSLCRGVFTLADSQTVVEIQHQCTTTRTTDGFGLSGAGFSQQELYTEVLIWELT